MTISRAFDPPDFAAAAAVDSAKSVQTSLFQRLKKKYGNRAGDLGWLLVRLGQPQHREHGAALDAIVTRPVEELTLFQSLVSAASSAAKTQGARDMCGVILTSLHWAENQPR